MNYQTNIQSSPLAEPQHGMAQMAPVVADGAAISVDAPIAADRIYQIAAVTAGLFFLATLL